MALILRCCKKQCNTKKLGFLGSHLTRHHQHPISSSWSFFTTNTTTTLPAEGSPDEHHRRGGTRTSIINERPAVDSTMTTTTTTTLPEEHCVGALTLGGGLGNLGGAAEKREAEINSRVKALAQFAAFAIGWELNLKKIEFVRVVSAMVQLVNNGQFYYITMEAMDGVVKKLYEAHVLDNIIESNTVSLTDWCELKSPPLHAFDSSKNGKSNEKEV